MSFVLHGENLPEGQPSEQEIVDAIICHAWEVVHGHTSGRRNRLDKHLCDSCTENIDELRESLKLYTKFKAAKLQAALLRLKEV